MKKKLLKILKKLDGWKTVIGAVGTPIATALIHFTPPHTFAHQASYGFTLLFGTTGIIGAIHKAIKGELPSGIRKQN